MPRARATSGAKMSVFKLYKKTYLFLLQRIHLSLLLAWLSAGFLAGIGLSIKTDIQISALIVLFIVCTCVLLVKISKSFRTWMSVLFFIVGGLFGVTRAGSLHIKSELIDTIRNEEVVIILHIDTDPTISPSSGVKISGKSTNIITKSDRFKHSLKLFVTLSESQLKGRAIYRDDTLLLRGKLSAGFGAYDASISYADIEMIYPTHLQNYALRFRDWFSDKVHLQLSSPEAELGLGYLVGQKGSIEPDIINSFRKTGLTHVLVASGYNLAILVALARKILFRLSRFTAVSGGLLFIIFFMFLAGFSPSLTRAGLVAGLSLVAWYFGRSFNPVILILFTAAVSVLWQPSYLQGDIGWYLSFLSFVGILLLSPFLQKYFYGNTEGSMLRSLLIDTLSAQIMTLPLVMFVFKEYSVIALIANVLVVPFIPLAMFLVATSGLLGIVLGNSWQALSFPAKVVIRYTRFIPEKLSEMPWVMQKISVTAWGLTISYVFIGITLLYLWQKTKVVKNTS